MMRGDLSSDLSRMTTDVLQRLYGGLLLMATCSIGGYEILRKPL